MGLRVEVLCHVDRLLAPLLPPAGPAVSLLHHPMLALCRSQFLDSAPAHPARDRLQAQVLSPSHCSPHDALQCTARAVHALTPFCDDFPRAGMRASLRKWHCPLISVSEGCQGPGNLQLADTRFKPLDVDDISTGIFHGISVMAPESRIRHVRVQAAVVVAGCVAHGVVRLEAAIGVGAGPPAWLAILLGRPPTSVPPGDHLCGLPPSVLWSCCPL